METKAGEQQAEIEEEIADTGESPMSGRKKKSYRQLSQGWQAIYQISSKSLVSRVERVDRLSVRLGDECREE